MIKQISNHDCNKQLMYEIADILKSRGYGIADTLTGKRVDEPQPSPLERYEAIGILIPYKNNFFGIPLWRSLAYTADLWIEHPMKNAVPNQRWVLDVYSQENLRHAKKLIEQIAYEYGLVAHVNLSMNKSRWSHGELFWPGIENRRMA